MLRNRLLGILSGVCCTTTSKSFQSLNVPIRRKEAAMKTHSRKSTQSKAQLTWLGHSAFKVVSPGGKTVLFDPWLDNPKAPVGAKDIAHIDLILISHGHSDHIGNTVALAKRTNAKVLAIYEVYLYLKSCGVENAQGMNKGGAINVDGIRVTMVDARHSSDIDVDGALIPGGEAAGYVVEFENGTKVYHAGDTSLFMDMKLIGQLYKPDVAILPIGDLYTMSPREAAKVCEWLHPKHIIGMHYGTFPALTGTPMELRRFLPAKLQKRVKELEIGKPFEL
jgi:L-ascorbate metabolism protein UlaG (beta-lactamase superfamily)